MLGIILESRLKNDWLNWNVMGKSTQECYIIALMNIYYVKTAFIHSYLLYDSNAYVIKNLKILTFQLLYDSCCIFNSKTWAKYALCIKNNDKIMST